MIFYMKPNLVQIIKIKLWVMKVCSIFFFFLNHCIYIFKTNLRNRHAMRKNSLKTDFTKFNDLQVSEKMRHLNFG